MSNSATPWTVAHQSPLFMEFSRQEYWVGCHFLLQGIFPIQGSNPGLLHCRQILYSLSHQGSPCFHTEVKWKSLSRVWLFLQPHVLYTAWNSPCPNTGVGSHSLLQEIFPTQWSNPGLPHCRWTLYQLSHQGSPGILEWVIYPFSRGSSWPRNWTGVSCIAGGFFTSWPTREALVFILTEY